MRKNYNEEAEQQRDWFVERFIAWRHGSPARRTAWVTAALLLAVLAGIRWAHSLQGLGGPVVAMLERVMLVGVLALLLVLAISILAARRGWKARWAPYLFAIACGSLMPAVILVAGPGSPTLFAWIPLVALLAMFCFDELIGAAVMLVGLGVIVLNEVVRIAPELAYSPSVDDEVQRFARATAVWLVFANFWLVMLILSAHRLTERRLQRSHSLIRRYLPAQLADRILAGGHDETAKHERRKLTIVFTDVVGFTALSDELDSEELATLLNEYLAEMTLVADRFGATVNQLIGDGIMIFFGAPAATDDRDHALRAVRMAQAMQQRTAELRERWFKRGLQRPFRIRIGINSGFASVGDFGSPGRMMYSAIGQQTNLAARIQGCCEPDRILLSHSTWALVQDEIACTPKGEVQVKGLHYPVLVYEVAPA